MVSVLLLARRVRGVLVGRKVLGGELVLLLAGVLLLLLDEPGLLGLAGLPDTDGSKEGLKVVVKILGVDAEVPVEEEEELLLHEVDLGDGEAEVVVAAHSAVASPVLVLWGRVVEVLGGKDEGSKEDAVGGALHALGDRRKTGPEAGEIDQAGHQSGDLDVRTLDEGCDELFDRWQERFPGLVGRRGRRCGRQALVKRSFTSDDLCGFLCEV